MNSDTHTPKSYLDILRSTGIIGGSKVIVIIIGIVKTKVIAVLLGPAGIGIIGLYQVTMALVSKTTNLGIGFSSVRDIAEANGSKDSLRIAKTILVLRRWVWFTGIFGMIITLVFCIPLSIYAFGDDSKAWGIAFLSITVLVTAISSGQKALLQGLRQIDKMAKAGILGAAVGLFISLPFYYFFGEEGIVPAMVLSAFAILFFTWWYARNVKVQQVKMNVRDTYKAGLGMVKLGSYTVIAGFVSIATMYAIRIFISNKLNVEAVGLFQASWSIATLYLGMVLDAMAADYFPRLSAVNNDKVSLTRLVNEQTEIGLIVAMPMVILLLVFLPFVIQIFYSASFIAAVPLLQWLLIGLFVRVISWPMGFVILAKSKGNIFVLIQLFHSIYFFSFFFIGWGRYQLEMAGIAYTMAFTLTTLSNFSALRKLIEFKWYRKSFNLIILNILFILITFLVIRFTLNPYNYIFGSLLLLVSLLFSYYRLSKLVDLKSIITKFFNKR